MEVALARPFPATARGRRTRQKLLDAAEHVFGQHGYYNAGILEITQRAGVALGTFYVYFPDKHAVFDDLVRTLCRGLRREIQNAVAGVEDRVEKEILGFETFFHFVQQHRNLYQVVRQAESLDIALHRWHYETIAKGYVRGLRDAQSKGQIAADLDPEAVAYALMGIAEALGMRSVQWKRRLPAGAARRSLRLVLERALRPPEDSR
ncbi:MAG: TetR/AcrR family transcriptional regulator [Chloroflexota bacterium]|nr:TetR/AcrR family transcriptional regulator [Chloroflexota bacterium]